MWQYNQTVPSVELYHYGVAGMKWGVRKSRVQMAREHALLSQDKRKVDKQYARTTQKIEGRQAKGKNVSEKLLRKQDQAKQSSQKISKMLKKNYSSLSEHEIARGKKILNGVQISALLFAPAGMAIGGVIVARRNIRNRAYARGSD